MEQTFVDEVLILLSSSVVMVMLFRRFGLPPILAYLVVGVIVGPNMPLGWIEDSHSIELLAEIGVVFLLFTIGMEFSLSQLLAMRGTLLGLGGAQVLVSTAAGAIIAQWIGLPLGSAIVVGGLLAMSSTAIVIRQLTEQLEMQSRHGRLALGILLFQDLAVVPLLVLIPILGLEGGDGITIPLFLALLKGVLAFGFILIFGRYVSRPLFRVVAGFRSTELFTLTALLVALSAAVLTSLLGLSLALGAFLAGIMLNETEFRHQIENEIRPFKDVLLGLFFIYVGLHLDPVAIGENLGDVVLLVAGLVVGKGVLIALLARISGNDPGVSARTGMVLAQGGEFGFAALALALSHSVLSLHDSQPIIAAIVISMAIAPLLIRYNGDIARHLFKESYLRGREVQEAGIRRAAEQLEDHVLLCGFGRIGQNLAHFLTEEGFLYMAVDLNPSLIRDAWEAGEPVFYGDCTHMEVLEAAGLERASVVVVTFEGTHAALRTVRIIRSRYPELPVLIRTRDDSRMDSLELAGATEVVPETLEASMMLVTHLLKVLAVPDAEIMRLVEKSRGDHYELLRGRFCGDEPEALEEPGRFHLHTVVLHEGSRAVGRTIGSIGLDRVGARISALRRGSVRGDDPSADLVLRSGDAVVLLGTREAIRAAELRMLS